MISIASNTPFHPPKPTLKSNLPHFVRDLSALIYPSTQKVLIIGIPHSFHFNFHMRVLQRHKKKGLDCKQSQFCSNQIMQAFIL